MKNLLYLLFFGCLVILNSCKPDPEPEPKPTEKTISLLTDNVDPGQVVLAQCSEAPNLNTDTKISVNGLQVTAMDAGNNQIGFLMPVLPAGKVIVDYANAGFNKKLDVTIKQYLPITNPESELNTFMAEVDKAILNLQEHVKSNITALDVDFIELIKYSNQTLKDNWNLLNKDDQEKLAYILKANLQSANQFILDSLNNDFYSAKKSDRPGEELVKAGRDLGWNVIVGVPHLAAGFTLAFAPSPLLIDKLAAVGFLTSGILNISSAISNAQRVGKLTGVPDENISVIQKREEKVILNAGWETDVKFISSYRTLKQSDVNSTSHVITGIFKSLSNLQDGYNKGVSLANKVISWFPWKTPKIPSYSNPIGADAKTQPLPLPGSGLSISNVSNPEIKLTTIQDYESLAIKAESATITNETEFTFTLQFTDTDLGLVIKKQMSAVYIPSKYFIVDENDNHLYEPKFTSGVTRYFYLAHGFGQPKATNIDYSKITMKNIGNNPKATATLTKSTSNFGLRFTSTGASIEYNTVEIYYNGVLVHPVHPEIAPDSLFLYKAKVEGNWLTQNIIKKDDKVYSETKLAFYSDGTGKRIASRLTYTNSDWKDFTSKWNDPDCGCFYTWNISRDSRNGKYVMSYKSTTSTLSYYGYIDYETMTFKTLNTPGASDMYSITKKE